jgi:exodeoxyribonuclease V beta subunit
MSSISPQLIPLDAPTLVQASAGTGKTYTITTYFVRAILERDLKPEEILVVTYTKAATAELRIRTRQRILDALLLLGEESKTDDALHGVVAATVERLGRRETEMKLRAALGEMDRAAILTIHGFCQRLLQDYPLLFGIDFDFEVAEDASSMYSELAVDFWTTELYDAPDWMLRALEAKKVSAVQLSKLAKVSVMPGIEILGPAPAGVDQAMLERWLLFKKEAAELWSARRGQVTEILTTNKDLSGTYYKPRTIEGTWLPALDEFFAKSGFTYPPEFLPKLAQGSLKMKKGRDEPRDPFFEACAPLWEAQQSLVPGLDHAVFRFQERFIEYARVHAKMRREDRAVLTYDDLLTLVYAPFDPSGPDSATFDRDQIAETVSTAYRLALVDEFQDTDAVQYGIFRAIYGESSVVYVGDPKQAIYAFRGADVFSYIGAVKDVGDRVHTLKTNRRSDAGVVHAVNTLFSLQTPPFLLEGIDMDEAIPHHEESRSTLDPPMELVFLEKDQLKGGVVAAVSPIVANEIALLLESEAQVEGRPVEPGDIAVLCRSNNQALAVTDALRELNVPVSLDGGSSVLGTEIASDLSAVLEAVLLPGDSSLVRRALLTSLLGVSPYDLATMSDEAWSEWVSRFRSWNEAWHSQGVVRFLEDMLRHTQAEATIATRPAARRVLTDLLHLEELLLRAERERGRNPVALMQWFRRLAKASPGEGTVASDDLQQRPDADAGAVRVATIHKSKGLEYGIVYCPFPWPLQFNEVAVKFHDEQGNVKVDLGSEGCEANKEASHREEFSEALRVLYVAVTRAKYRCTLYWGRAKNWKKAALGYLLHGAEGLGKLDEDGMRAGVEKFVAASSGTVEWRATHDQQAAPREHEPPRRALAAREQVRYFSHAPRIASFTSLTGHDEKTPGPRPAVSPVERQPALFSDLPGGVRTGLLLHSILEHADFQQLGTIETGQLIERQLHAFGFDAALTPEVQRDLLSVAATPFTDAAEAPRLDDLSRDVQLRELEFTLRVDRPKLSDLAEILSQHDAPAAAPRYFESLADVSGQTLQRFLRGYIDLMFEWQGRWYVADYKSNTLPTYAPEGVNEAVQRTHYLLQAQLYTAAAQRYLKQRVLGYDPETQWGGALFLFLRGMRGPQSAGSSVFFDRQPVELLSAVDRWLGGADESV